MAKKKKQKQVSKKAQADDFSGYECDLECARVGSFKEFVGPVKIILMETPPEVYKQNAMLSALLTATYIFIGVMFMTATLFTYNYALPYSYNGHIFYCTAAYQLLFPVGILSFNRFNIIAKTEKPRDRKVEHSICQIVGFFSALRGGFGTYGIKGGTVHSATGWWANFFMLFAVGLSFATIKRAPFGQEQGYLLMSTFHKGFGIFSFLLGGICFITGVTKDNFMAWLRQDYFAYFLAFLCFFMMVVVLNDPLRVFIYKLAKLKKGEELTDVDDEESFRRFGEKKPKKETEEAPDATEECPVHMEPTGKKSKKKRIPCSECCTGDV